ncbi:chemotaxis protein CheW [Mesobacillus subterraneus]|jgi:purine-binding chemotaxis protein CheW|uniref:chemotaxis protein CheW n=1 Tax=Mesobacillus subterraneus TaxID=285983 RepID=UPI00203DFACC|nr:chemotaxis protein CheW [Mesobacillus subterraneus]MCM3666387.1 chemotaxis protein CheW [Mesobacillus subterraneus]MCM3685341.1 chemotaxis protein CheW [Mesobacillus subterraneus]
MKRTFIIFKARGAEYGIDLQKVVSIERNSKVTTLPQVPDYMVGIVSIRGKVIPVIDSNFLLFQKYLQGEEEPRYILLEVQGSTIALMVESTNEILEIEDSLIKPVEMMNANYWIEGVALKGDRIISIIDSGEMISTIRDIKHIQKELLFSEEIQSVI